MLRFAIADIRAGHNILRRGTSMRAGDVVLRSAAPCGLSKSDCLAEIGRTQGPSRAAADGRHPADRQRTGRARRAAGGRADSQLERADAGRCRPASGAEPIALAVARDNEADLRQKISAGLAADVLLLSGGVSAGVLDLVPKVLAELGAEQVFHKVSVKPGKPLWFGVARRGEHETLVFGLPGNPVSTFVCFELFVRPAIEGLSGRPGCGLARAAPGSNASIASAARGGRIFPRYIASGKMASHWSGRSSGMVRPISAAWQGPMPWWRLKLASEHFTPAKWSKSCSWDRLVISMPRT